MKKLVIIILCFGVSSVYAASKRRCFNLKVNYEVECKFESNSKKCIKGIKKFNDKCNGKIPLPLSVSTGTLVNVTTTVKPSNPIAYYIVKDKGGKGLRCRKARIEKLKDRQKKFKTRDQCRSVARGVKVYYPQMNRCIKAYSKEIPRRARSYKSKSQCKKSLYNATSNSVGVTGTDYPSGCKYWVKEIEKIKNFLRTARLNEQGKKMYDKKLEGLNEGLANCVEKYSD
jgi:hypothetical protein